MTFSPYLGFWTKTVQTLGEEKEQRKLMIAEIKHRYDSINPISLLIALGLTGLTIQAIT